MIRAMDSLPRASGALRALLVLGLCVLAPGARAAQCSSEGSCVVMHPNGEEVIAEIILADGRRLFSEVKFADDESRMPPGVLRAFGDDLPRVSHGCEGMSTPGGACIVLHPSVGEVFAEIILADGRRLFSRMKPADGELRLPLGVVRRFNQGEIAKDGGCSGSTDAPIGPPAGSSGHETTVQACVFPAPSRGGYYVTFIRILWRWNPAIGQWEPVSVETKHEWHKYDNTQK
ncbi:MAG: hypothetical protein KatS3mg126_0156 [Lysobacteraceae bacterium]|nr:MAG: hypothetical protein KatS3mg126_0156 [Xanthomonadaceae bacterium]